MASSLQAAGGLTSLRTLILCLVSLLLLLQPADSSAAPDTRTWSQTGPRLQLSHSGRKCLSTTNEDGPSELKLACLRFSLWFCVVLSWSGRVRWESRLMAGERHTYSALQVSVNASVSVTSPSLETTPRRIFLR